MSSLEVRVTNAIDVAKGMLPYRGLGSGIKRVLEAWPEVELVDDREGCLFTATVLQKQHGTVKAAGSPKSSPKTENRIIELIRADARISAERMGTEIGISKRAVLKQINKLKGRDRIRRVGPARGGHWEILE